MKKILNVILLFLLVAIFFNIRYTTNAYVIENEATYRVSETLEEEELFYGLQYRHDYAFSSVLNDNRIVGYACGGATYSTESFVKGKEYPQHAFVLNIPSSSGVSLVPWGIMENGSWKLSTVLQIADNYETKHPGYKVIAAMNADFFDISADDDYPYTPLGGMVVDGEVYKAIIYNNWPMIAFKNDGSLNPFIKIDDVASNILPTLSVYDSNGVIIYNTQITKINQELKDENDTILYYAPYYKDGSSHLVRPNEVSDAFLVTKPITMVAYNDLSFYGKGEIKEVGSKKLGVEEFAIKTNNSELLTLLKKGVTIRIQHQLTGSLQDVQNACGICNTFLENGVHTDQKIHYDYMAYRYPRTLIGRKANGDIVMAVTDGRQPDKERYGLNGVESAAQMLYEGCVDAYTFDGGGSTTMAILKDGKLTCVNSPSDGGLRRDANALLVVAKVPEINMVVEAKEDELAIKIDVLKMLEGYNDLYLEINDKKEKIISGNTIVIKDLNTNSKYPYQIYALINGEYYRLPFLGDLYTAKEKYSINNVTIGIEKDNKGKDYYAFRLNTKDEYNTIVNVILYLNKHRVYEKEGVFMIPLEYGNPLFNGILSIGYETDPYSGRRVDEINNYNLVLDNPIIIIDAMCDLIDKTIDNYIN